MTIESDLQSLINELPEVYQPIYGHPEFGSSRDSASPRMTALVSAVRLIGEALGRPLRILDLGSAQGFTSFTLAELGHQVVGIEMQQVNVDVARRLAKENPELSTEFVVGDIADTQKLVDLSTFDVVLGLSVLHHISQRDGHDMTVELIQTLVDNVPFGLYEMASSSEPLYWAAALPNDPRITLAPYAFVREIARSRTHLSEIERPTFLCSRTHVVVSERLIEIESVTSRSHRAVGDPTDKRDEVLRESAGIDKDCCNLRAGGC